MPDIWDAAYEERRLTGGQLRDMAEHSEALARMRFCGHDPFEAKCPAKPREKKSVFPGTIEQEAISKMRVMRSDGATLKMIAEKFGCAISTVWEHLRSAG